MFRVSKAFKFDASHQLEGYPGKCGERHGHTWRVWLTVEGGQLEQSMLIDYAEIAEKMAPILERLDHHDLNVIPWFDGFPTSEAVARYIAVMLERQLDNERRKLAKVTVWESDDNCCEYTP